jgi:division protein CdvB (Snf7/Vps24/ESCRT-III family)
MSSVSELLINIQKQELKVKTYERRLENGRKELADMYAKLSVIGYIEDLEKEDVV